MLIKMSWYFLVVTLHSFNVFTKMNLTRVNTPPEPNLLQSLELFYFSSVLISKFDFWLFNDTISNLDFQQLIFALPVFVD